MFIYLIIIMKLFFSDKGLLIVYGLRYCILLFSFINEMFNLCIDNVVGK